VQQQGQDTGNQCLSFAKCKTFGDCHPTQSPAAAAFKSTDAAAAIVAQHARLQTRRGHQATPVLKLDAWMLKHVAADDALLPTLLNRQRSE
jgi:hypothetical protein